MGAGGSSLASQVASASPSDIAETLRALPAQEQGKILEGVALLISGKAGELNTPKSASNDAPETGAKKPDAPEAGAKKLAQVDVKTLITSVVGTYTYKIDQFEQGADDEYKLQLTLEDDKLLVQLLGGGEVVEEKPGDVFTVPIGDLEIAEEEVVIALPKNDILKIACSGRMKLRTGAVYSQSKPCDEWDWYVLLQ